MKTLSSRLSIGLLCCLSLGYSASAFAYATGILGTACTGCHTDSERLTVASVTHSLSPGSQFEAGSTYDLMVQLEGPFDVGGFNFSVVSGSLLAGPGTKLLSDGSITHTSPTRSSWEFQWTPVATGPVSWTLFGLLANGNFTFTGDSVAPLATGAFLVFAPGTVSVPEPATLGLLGAGLAALALRRRRRTGPSPSDER